MNKSKIKYYKNKSKQSVKQLESAVCDSNLQSTAQYNSILWSLLHSLLSGVGGGGGAEQVQVVWSQLMLVPC